MTRKIDIVMGGAFGDEGKGTLANWLSRQNSYDICIGPFGCQSSHTYYRNGQRLEGHHISAGWETSKINYIPASAVINPIILWEEYELCKKFKPNFELVIHPLATVTYGDVESEDYMQNGSMGFGISKARADRLLRKARLAREESSLKEFVVDQEGIDTMFRHNHKILIESGQGYGLSQHSIYYPYVSSTINTPYGILANAGIPWNFGVVSVYMIIRPYFTRTPNPPGGTSGPLVDECDSMDLEEAKLPPQIETWGQYKGLEMRHGSIDYKIMCMAIAECNPSFMVLSWADWLLKTCNCVSLLRYIEDRIGRKFDLLGMDLTEFEPRNRILSNERTNE